MTPRKSARQPTDDWAHIDDEGKADHGPGPLPGSWSYPVKARQIRSVAHQRRPVTEDRPVLVEQMVYQERRVVEERPIFGEIKRLEITDEDEIRIVKDQGVTGTEAVEVGTEQVQVGLDLVETGETEEVVVDEEDVEEELDVTLPAGIAAVSNLEALDVAELAALGFYPVERADVDHDPEYSGPNPALEFDRKAGVVVATYYASEPPSEPNPEAVKAEEDRQKRLGQLVKAVEAEEGPLAEAVRELLAERVG